jgi:hypothetical protein
VAKRAIVAQGGVVGVAGRLGIGSGLIGLHGVLMTAAVVHFHGLHVMVRHLLAVVPSLLIASLLIVMASAHPAGGKALYGQPQQKESDQEGAQAGSHGTHSRFNPRLRAIPIDGI